MVLLSINTNTGKMFSKFSDIEIKKQKFHFPKKGIHISKVDTTKIIVSEGFTYLKNGSESNDFVGYK